MWALIGGIALEGLKLFSDEKRKAIMRDYHDLIVSLRKAENAGFKEYTDADLDIIEEKIYDFLDDFRTELKVYNAKAS